MNLGKPDFDEEGGGMASMEIEPRQASDIGAADRSPTAASLMKKRSSLGAATTEENKKQQLNQAKMIANSTVGVSPGLKRRQPGA